MPLDHLFAEPALLGDGLSYSFSTDELSRTSSCSPDNLSYTATAAAAAAQQKRMQVKRACINCKNSCKKCDEVRPCTRCIKIGMISSCEDIVPKPRTKGFKRGPYKKRAIAMDGKGSPPMLANIENITPAQSPEYPMDLLSSLCRILNSGRVESEVEVAKVLFDADSTNRQESTPPRA